MPGGDRTGPLGAGPMTGRAAGYCAGYSTPGYMKPGPGWGFGIWGRGGRGGGRGWRNWFHATGLTGWQRVRPGWSAYGAPWGYPTPYASNITKEQEIETLKGQAKYFEDAVEEIRKRIQDLETKSDQNS